jgi:ribonuclease P/MRP protein subunit POP5
MVRLKTRYLLFEILYPDELPDIGLDSKEKVDLALRNPNNSGLDARKLSRLLKESIELNFGDFGLGSVASTVAGKYHSSSYIHCLQC